MMGRFSSSSYQENPAPFTMFFPSENDDVYGQHHDQDSYSAYDHAPVDCTLSLGTPSTRLVTEEDRHDKRRLGWDFLPSGSGKTASYMPQTPRSIRHGGDHVVRRCANCDTTSTPLWRNGPRGPKSLCNACGIRFKKEERRATAGKQNSGGGSSAAGAPAEYQYSGGDQNYYNHYYDSSSWHQQPQRVPCYYSPAANEYTFVDDVRDGDSDVTASFLSWRLNVADQLY